MYFFFLNIYVYLYIVYLYIVYLYTIYSLQNFSASSAPLCMAHGWGKAESVEKNSRNNDLQSKSAKYLLACGVAWNLATAFLLCVSCTLPCLLLLFSIMFVCTNLASLFFYQVISDDTKIAIIWYVLHTHTHIAYSYIHTYIVGCFVWSHWATRFATFRTKFGSCL